MTLDNDAMPGPARCSAQGGAGVLQAAYGYDTSGTGNLTSLTTHGAVNATTTWEYDPNTGQLLEESKGTGVIYDNDSRPL